MPTIQEMAPKTPEEATTRMNANLSAAQDLLNAALDGGPINENWKRELRELSEGYDFLSWQISSNFPSMSQFEFIGASLPLQVRRALHQFSTLQSTQELGVITKNHANYIKEVKEFMPIQRVLKGIVEATGDKFTGMEEIQKALAFDPFAESNPITLKESDL